jgi:HlyD family secretion protein
MLKRLFIGVFVLLAAVGVALALIVQPAAKRPAQPSSEDMLAAPVTVVRVARAHFRETVLVTGSLVAREEVLVGPEVEGLRVTEVLADEGMRVKKGDVLARLVSDTLEAQLAQNDAALARAEAASAQARSGIVQAEARLLEANNAFERAKPLRTAGHLAESAYDQREQAARTAEAQLLAARDGLKVAEAEKGQIEAQRRELLWRRGRTEVIAPADGIVSRRMARIGAFAAGSAEPMFRIVAKGGGGTRCGNSRDPAVGRTGRPAGSPRGRRGRRSDGPCAPRLARNRQAHATGPRAHLSGRQRRPARGLLRARFNRNRRRRGSRASAHGGAVWIARASGAADP